VRLTHVLAEQRSLGSRRRIVPERERNEYVCADECHTTVEEGMSAGVSGEVDSG